VGIEDRDAVAHARCCRLPVDDPRTISTTCWRAVRRCRSAPKASWRRRIC